MNNLTTVASKLRHARFLQYVGPGFIVTVGFIDPGNFATNAQGGAEFAISLPCIEVTPSWSDAPAQPPEPRRARKRRRPA